jgi:phospholipase/carboxylesterase
MLPFRHQPFPIAAALLLFVGCDSDSPPVAKPPTPSLPQQSERTARPWGGLKVRFSGAALGDATRIIILMHGFGAAGDDLMSLAPLLDDSPATAFIFPEAPIPLESGGFAWAQSDQQEFKNAIQQVTELLTELRNKHPQCRITIGGFSQGATLASNLLAGSNLGLEGVILYSPALNLIHAPTNNDPKTTVFLAHGRTDPILPFANAEQLKDSLLEAGYQVDWQPFDGGHTLTRELLTATRNFLAKPTNSTNP